MGEILDAAFVECELVRSEPLEGFVIMASGGALR
jgi:hypothetical protein